MSARRTIPTAVTLLALLATGYVVFAQVRVRPGSRLQGLDFAWSDSNATGSSRLVMPVKVARTCPAD